MRAPSVQFLALTDRIWEALQAEGLRVTYIDRVTIASYCPVCRRGMIGVWFVDGDPPEMRLVRGGKVVTHCTMGCPEKAIGARLWS